MKKLYTILILTIAAQLVYAAPDQTSFYFYKAHVTSVYDGDTITVDISLGLGLVKEGERIRLYGIDTPEIRGGTVETKARGFAARDFLRELLLDKDIILETVEDKSGKYGRLLGVLWVDGVNVNRLLIAEGHAVEYLL